MMTSENSPEDSLASGMLLNKDTYAESYLPVYEKLGIKPRLLLQFPVILPFHLPLRGGTCATFALDGGDACTLCFTTLTTTQAVHAGVVGPEPVKVPLHRS